MVNLPIVKFSVDWWTTLHQGSSVFKVSGPKHMTTDYLITLMVSFLPFYYFHCIGLLIFFISLSKIDASRGQNYLMTSLQFVILCYLFFAAVCAVTTIIIMLLKKKSLIRAVQIIKLNRQIKKRLIFLLSFSFVLLSQSF